MGCHERPRGQGVGGEENGTLALTSKKKFKSLHCFSKLLFQEQIRAEQNDITQQREQLYRKMEVLTSQGLLISPNVAIPVGGLADDSSKETSEDSSPQSDSSSAASGVSSTASGVSSANQTSLGHSASTAERRKDSKWTKSKYHYVNIINCF